MTAITHSPAIPFLVVFGRDTAGKPHASWFDQASADLAAKAAQLMNMQAVKVEGDALRQVVDDLPRGRVFSSGRAFTPFVKGKLYGRLVELTRDLLGASDTPLHETAAGDSSVDQVEATSAEAKAAEAKPAGGEPVNGAPMPKPGADGNGDVPVPRKASQQPSQRPSQPDQIGMGSLVLATTGPTEGWYEAEVIGLNGTMLTLRWRDYAEPTVVRRREEVGFLPAAKL